MARISITRTGRRQFLHAGFAVAAGVVPAVIFASEQTKRATTKPRRIGFVDDNLDNYHSRTYLKHLRDELKGRGFEVTGAFALQAEKSRRWAEEHEVPWFDSVERLNDSVDCFAVLAPSTPQVHWKLCQHLFPFDKPTFVDKTFALDAATAQKIFDLADQHGVAVQTSSALRYTAVQQHVASAGEKVRHMVAWGGGGNFDEYVIHPLELVISCMGHDVKSVMRRGGEPESQLLVNFSGGRTAVINIYTKARTPYAAAVTTARATVYITVDTKRLFVDAAAGFLDFFEAGKALIDRRETMAAMRIIDSARDPRARKKFVDV